MVTSVPPPGAPSGASSGASLPSPTPVAPTGTTPGLRYWVPRIIGGIAILVFLSKIFAYAWSDPGPVRAVQEYTHGQVIQTPTVVTEAPVRDCGSVFAPNTVLKCSVKEVTTQVSFLIGGKPYHQCVSEFPRTPEEIEKAGFSLDVETNMLTFHPLPHRERNVSVWASDTHEGCTNPPEKGTV